MHNRTPAHVWDKHYKAGVARWQSSGPGSVTEIFLDAYSNGKNILEIGCGTGADAPPLVRKGFIYTGVDISAESIRQAQERNVPNTTFIATDVLSYEPVELFNVVYDKGVFHNLGGPVLRQEFAQHIATMLKPNGIWITVCGSADNYDNTHPHGAIFLQHLIAPIEAYFEILEVQKAPYGIQKPHQDFPAWYCVSTKR